MKIIISIATCCILSCAIFAKNQQFSPSRFYLIENGNVTNITQDVLSKKQPLEGLRQFTVTGYVKYPGIYFSKSPCGLVDLLGFAGRLQTPDGSISSSKAFVISGSSDKKVLLYDIQKATILVIKDPKSQPMLSGNEIVYRDGIRF